MEVTNLFGETVRLDPYAEGEEPAPAGAENPEAEPEEEEDEHGEGFGEYNNPIGLTSQFRFCGNPLRADTYRGCTFGCKYCFANARTGPEAGMFQRAAGPANLRSAANLLRKAYTNEPTKNVVVECLRRGVPMHLGGMSDPFQAREFKERNTAKFLRLTEQYKHPILISTKAAQLLPEHWELLNPERHAFQVSLIGTDADWLRRWETGTPTPYERFSFIFELKERGFWVGLRIQPLIDIEQALSLVRETRGMVDYYTVEHLKLPMDNKEQRAIVTDLLGTTGRGLYVMVSRSAEMRTSIKEKNLERIKEAAQGVPVGAGDNDLHHLTDSRCCCGVDTIGTAFSRWMKYNTTFFDTAPIDSPEPREKIWHPSNNVGGCFLNHAQADNLGWSRDFSKAVDDFHAILHEKYAKKNAQMTVDEYLALEEADG